MAHGIKVQHENGDILIAKYSDMDTANEVRLSLSETYPDTSFVVQQVIEDEAVVVTEFAIPETDSEAADDNELPEDETNSFPSDETNQDDREA